MKYRLAILALMALGTCGGVNATEALNLEHEEARINYSLGYQIGGDFKRQKLNIDPEAVVQGIQDALSGAQPKMTAQEMRATLVNLKRKVVAEQQTRRRSREITLVTDGKRFMEENKNKEGVVTTGSGLQYRLLEPGSGRSPSPTDQVTVQYRGRKMDGVEFDSSFKRGKPTTFQLDKVIKGWTEGLQLVKEGGRIELFIPPNLAYGRRGPLAHETLIFDVELIAVGDQAADEEAGVTREADEAKTSQKQ